MCDQVHNFYNWLKEPVSTMMLHKYAGELQLSVAEVCPKESCLWVSVTSLVKLRLWPRYPICKLPSSPQEINFPLLTEFIREFHTKCTQVSRQLVVCRPLVGRLLPDSWPFVGLNKHFFPIELVNTFIHTMIRNIYK